jgi:hypothetical protein
VIRGLAVALMVMLAAPAVGLADAPPPGGFFRLRSAARVTTEGGTVLDLPPDWLLISPAKWEDIDAETRRLQDQETRLTTENKYLKNHAGTSSASAWWVAGAFVLGAVGGVVWWEYDLKERINQ